MAFEVGKVFHLIHMADDFDSLNGWYHDVFGVVEFSEPGPAFPYYPTEMRYASLIQLGDCVIEPMAAGIDHEGWEQSPVGRFYQRFGQHWHSIAWFITDTLDLYRHMKAEGVRFFGQGGATGDEPKPTDPLFAHPKDTICALEFMDPDDQRGIWSPQGSSVRAGLRPGGLGRLGPPARSHGPGLHHGHDEGPRQGEEPVGGAVAWHRARRERLGADDESGRVRGRRRHCRAALDPARGRLGHRTGRSR